MHEVQNYGWVDASNTSLLNQAGNGPCGWGMVRKVELVGITVKGVDFAAISFCSKCRSLIIQDHQLIFPMASLSMGHGSWLDPMPGSHYDWLVTLAKAIISDGGTQGESTCPPVSSIIHSGLRRACGMSDWCKALQGSPYKTWPMEAGHC